MGPHVLTDKSVIQSLGAPQLSAAFRHLRFVITPILMEEVRADLTRKDGPPAATLAEKIHSTNYCVPAAADNLVLSELCNGPMQLTWQTPVHGQFVKDGEGFIVDGTDSERLFAWSQDLFREEDRSAAEAWRQALAAVDLVPLREAMKKYSKLSDPSEVAAEVEGLFEDSLDEALLHEALRVSGATTKVAETVLGRWNSESRPPMAKFAPFTHHCTKARLIFQVALGANVVGPRKSNVADLQYLMYAPFCHAFSSGDKFHAKLAPLVLRDDQSFIPAATLQEDLTNLSEWWEALDEKKWGSGVYPPEEVPGPTLDLWKHHMRPRAEVEAPSRISDEVALKLIRHLTKGVPGFDPEAGPGRRS